MQIVIDIPEEYYNFIKNNEDRFSGSRIYDCVLNGTVLPEGHGKLIDSNILWNAFQDLGQDFYEAFDFAEANAVIEADETESEE